MFYELTTINNPNSNQREILNSIMEKVEKYNGRTLSWQDNGEMPLSYPMYSGQEKFETGHYHCYGIEIDNMALAKISSELNVEKNVLRYLISRIS